MLESLERKPLPASLALCSVKMLAGLPPTATAVGQSQGLSGLAGLALWATGRCHQSRLPPCPACRLLSTLAEESGKHQLRRKKI